MLKVLVVDDSKAMRMIVKRILRQIDIGEHSIVEAEDGAEGLKQVDEHNPDLILSDWNMPNMNGIEFLGKVREENQRVKFGFVTTEGSEKMRNLANDTGANFMITKPFTPESFEKSLMPVLAKAGM